MSQREIEVLKDLSISFSEIAHFLGVTRQSVTRGVEGDSQYIDENRAAQIYSKMQLESPEAADAFRHACTNQLDIDVEDFDELPTTALRDGLDDGRGPMFSRKELWIFTSRPKELYSREYLQRLSEDVFVKTERSVIERLIYFVPHDIVRPITNLIRTSMQRVPAATRIRAQIVATPLAQLATHFMILDPRSDPEGWVMVETEDRFLRMPSSRTEAIMDYLVKAGVGISDGGPTKQSSMDHMEVHFDSEEDDLLMKGARQ